MGYRSDVALVLTKQGVDALKNEISKLDINSEERKCVAEFLANPDKHIADPSDGSELWYWEDIKWYSDYLDVAFLENFMLEKVNEEDFRFIRIGEDYEDAAVEGWFCNDSFDLHLSRSIKFSEV